MKAARLVFLGVLLLSLSCCDIQRSLLYYPGDTTISDVERYASANGLEMWPEPSVFYRGIISRKGPAASRGTVVIFHGNGGPAVLRVAYIEALHARGYRVVLAEYPGYGGRPGDLSEKSFVADARNTVLRAREYFGDPVYLWGESMGCGVAAALAADPEIRPQGVVMLTPWDSLLNVAKAKFPLIPVRFLLTDSYDNMENLAGYGGPVAVIMAKRDEIIPNRLTERLYASLGAPKRLWTFENAGHNDWPSGPESGWWDEVMTFLASNRAEKTLLKMP